MRKLPLLMSLVGTLALSSMACEDDTKTPARDAAGDARDGGSDALDSSPGDRPPEVVDATPDLRDVAAPMDTTPSVDLRDVAPAVDLRDVALPVDTAPEAVVETSPDLPDASLDVAVDVATDAGTDGGTDAGTDGGTDAGTDGGTDGGTDLGTDAVPVARLINNCTMYQDRSADAASRSLVWAPALASNLARCLKVKVGQQVVLNGDFSAYPLINDEGDTPSPIPGKNSGDTLIIIPTVPGTFGYAATTMAAMTGAIYAVP